MPIYTDPGKAPSPKTYTAKLENFAGVDLTSGAVNVIPERSPEAPNMMPDENGYPKKRYGYFLHHDYGETVWAGHKYVLGGEEHLIIHAGTKLYDGEALVYEDMNEAPSQACQLDSKLWILDGKTFLVYDGETCSPVSESATIPRITVSKAPNGNGAYDYEPINLLTNWVMDSFLGTAADKIYVLSFGELTDSAIKVEKLDSEGVWQIVSTGYTVDRTAGKVTFTTAPGGPPVEGEDNVRITYERNADNTGQINRCRYCILYGVKGMMDRLFVAGNPDEPNIDHFSELEDPSFMGDINYGMLGQNGSPIMGYSVLNGKLITHKQDEENDRNVFFREGEVESREDFQTDLISFPLVNVIQGEGVISSRSFGYLSGEPMFLTSEGIAAITPSDITGERYVETRSYYIRSGLLSEDGLEDACAVNFGRFYMLAVNGKIYLLDGEQRVYEKNEPHSNHQYEGYYWTGIPATSIFVSGKELMFGASDGKVYQFHSDKNPGYMDDGNVVEAYWTIPLLNMDDWSRIKNIIGVWVVGQPNTRSGGNIYFITDQNDEFYVGSYEMDTFTFSDVDFDRWTFNPISRPSVVPVRKKAKKVILFALKVENRAEDETFGIQAVQMEYRKGSRVRR